MDFHLSIKEIVMDQFELFDLGDALEETKGVIPGVPDTGPGSREL
jgi:hypothetical protein